MCNGIQHPGLVLSQEIEKLGMKQNELAIRAGVSEKHISTIICGTKDISPSLARRLEYALGSPKGYWGKVQAEYDRAVADLKEANEITDDEVAVLRQLKEIIDYFISNGIMHNDCDAPQKVLQLRSILRVSNLTSIPKITYNAAYRAQLGKNTSIDPYVLFAWQRLCEIQTDSISLLNPFSIELLRNSIQRIKSTMFISDPNEMRSQLKGIFAECGIAFDIVRHFKGAPVQGFIKEADNHRVVLCLTIRGKKADRFWFSLFHEIGHLLNGDLNMRFIDFSSVKSDAEENADRFARNELIDPDRYRGFVEEGNFYDLNAIKSFSAREGVPYWITIGRLQNDEWLDWSQFAHEAPSYEWAS